MPKIDRDVAVETVWSDFQGIAHMGRDSGLAGGGQSYSIRIAIAMKCFSYITTPGPTTDCTDNPGY